jgi:hypothetical protein
MGKIARILDAEVHLSVTHFIVFILVIALGLGSYGAYKSIALQSELDSVKGQLSEQTRGSEGKWTTDHPQYTFSLWASNDSYEQAIELDTLDVVSVQVTGYLLPTGSIGFRLCLEDSSGALVAYSEALSRADILDSVAQLCCTVPHADTYTLAVYAPELSGKADLRSKTAHFLMNVELYHRD